MKYKLFVCNAPLDEPYSLQQIESRFTFNIVAGNMDMHRSLIDNINQTITYVVAPDLKQNSVCTFKG